MAPGNGASPPDSDMQDLTGRTALITGASTGIGRATAAALAARGAHVAVNYPTDDERANADESVRLAEAAARDAGASGTVVVVRADVSDEAQVAEMFATVTDALGTVDVLVNNAGIQIEEPASHLTDPADFDRVLAVNLRGAFLCAQQALCGFLARSPSGGVIVNVSSVHQQIPRPRYLSYAVSKYGLHGLTQTLALEYASRGVRVNSVAPGATRTPIQSWLDDEDAADVVRSHIPQDRIAEPAEIARVIAFLASDAAAYVTGQTLFADGGLTLYPEFETPWSG